MNVPVTSPGPQVYVEISSLSAQISSSNNVEDVHICGSCKRNFSDLDLFVEHKRAGCAASTPKPLSTTVAPSYSQSSLGYVTANTSNGNEESIPSLGTQYLRVILDDEQLNMQGNPSQNQQLSSTIHCPANSDHQILGARLLGVAEQDTSVANHPDFQNSSDLHSLVLEEQQSNTKQREFQIDEEDVATLLANQLASEVVNSVNETSIEAKTGLINISRELVPKSQNHFDLESINLPAKEEIDLKVDNAKKCHAKERGASKNNNSNSVTSGNSRWTNGNKGIGSKQNVPVATSSDDTGIVNAGTSISSVGISQVVSPANTLIVDGPTGKKKHKCTQGACDFTTWYLKDLVRHERKHTGERPFQCYSCHRNFSRLDKLHMHERIHTGDKRYRCEVCDYATHDSGSLRKHMRIHNDERPYKCQMCPYRSRDSSQLTVHLRTHTGDNPFVCTFENCTSAFKTSSDLKRHSRTHTGEKPFACSYCQYKCAIKSNLRVHIRLTHSEAKSISCNTCSYVASTRREVKEHEKTHAGEDLKCGICSYTCVNAAGMKSHCKIHTQDKVLSCKHCSFTCRIAASLKTHMKKKHPETVRKKSKGTGKDSADSPRNQTSGRPVNTRGLTHLKPFCMKSHKCTYCDAAFVREDSWRSHMRQHKNASSINSGAPTALLVTEPPSNNTSNNETVAVPDNTVTLEVSSEPESKRTGGQKNDIISTDYLILSSNNDTLKETNKYIAPNHTDGNADITADSGIETSFVQYSVGEKSDKEQIPVVHQLTQEVLNGDNLQSQPILLYVQNAPVLHSVFDSNLRNAEIVGPILVTGRCGQFLQLDQGGSLVEQFSSPLPQGMQYIVSAPFEGVVGGNTTYIQPLETADNSGNSVPVVSFQLDRGSVLTTQEGSS